MKTLIVVVMETVLFISPESDAAGSTEQVTHEPTGGYGNPNNPYHPAAMHPGHTKHQEQGESDHP